MSMIKYLAPRTLTINGKPSPCECMENDEIEVVCGYCIQANFLAYSRKEPEADSKPLEPFQWKKRRRRRG